MIFFKLLICFRTVDANDVRIVPSAQTERVTPSLRYAGTQFKLHGSDFPRLGKSAPSSGASGAVGIAQSSKSGAKTQKAIVEETVAASDSCGVSFPAVLLKNCE